MCGTIFQSATNIATIISMQYAVESEHREHGIVKQYVEYRRTTGTICLEDNQIVWAKSDGNWKLPASQLTKCFKLYKGVLHLIRL